jgi:cell wall-associated NlpC family hydrolase
MSGSMRASRRRLRMRRNWLAPAAVTAIALGVPVAGGVAQAAPMYGQQLTTVGPISKTMQHHESAHPVSFNQNVASYVKRFEGAPYAWGGTTPAGFDCSGLTQYVYRHFGRHIQRTAEDQFLQFRRISKARAWRGDLVFFHVDSDQNSYVYHVGIYEGGDNMVAATTYGEGVQWQSFSWAGDTVTFGTISH